MGSVVERRIAIPYTPRAAFLAYHNRRQRFACNVVHRRAGKTVAAINDLVRSAITCRLPEARCAYVAPTFGQAKDVAWTYLKRFAAPLLAGPPSETELRVDLLNGSRVRLYGADNPDRLRGLYLDDVVLDEFSQQPAQIWGEIVRPLLADRKGRATFIGTPKGHDAFYSLYQDALDNPDEWFSMLLPASESGILDPGELAAARRTMSDNQYAQEFECSFEAAIQGAYYGTLMAEAEAEERICRVPHDPALQVETWWDLGVGDSTSIWFAQRLRNREIRLIDYYEATGEGLAHYVNVLGSKKYNYSRHIAPHDIQVRELGTGRSRKEVASELGLDFDVAPRLSLEDGIEAVRMILPLCWFDRDKCGPGIEALKQYRADYNDKMRSFKPTPVHDWTSHGSDAFRYGAIAPELFWGGSFSHSVEPIV